MNRYFAALAQRSGAFVPAPRSMRTHALDTTSAGAENSNAMGGAALEVEQVVYAEPATTPATHRVVEPATPHARVVSAAVSATMNSARATSSGTSAQQPPAATSPGTSDALLDSRMGALREHPSPASRAPEVEQRTETIVPGPERSTLAHAVAGRTLSLLHSDAPLARSIGASVSLSTRTPATSTAAAVDSPSRATTTEQLAAARSMARHDATRGDRPRAPSPPTPNALAATDRATASSRSFDIAAEMTPGARVSESMRALTRASESPATAATVDIHIGAINLEIRQPQAPAPVAAPRREPQRAQPEPRRLSRFYLRGWQ
jgi:hypothetical protein